jgi:hypothetical protein
MKRSLPHRAGFRNIGKIHLLFAFGFFFLAVDERHGNPDYYAENNGTDKPGHA